MTMTRFALASVFSLALFAQGCIIVDDSDDGDSILTIDNQSDYALYEIYIAAIDDPSWGPDLTGGDFLAPGEAIDIFDIECDFYDVLVVDELGAECELRDVDLCFSDAVWVITNGTLSQCPIFAQNAAKLAAQADGAKATVDGAAQSQLEAKAAE